MSSTLPVLSTSSTSMPSAKSKTKKTRARASTPDVLPTKYGPVEVVSRPSNSRLAELYKSKEFAKEWANDIPFHVARNVFHLRRYRKISQAELAEAMKTSQPAIARIENGHENITLDTLQRLVTALNGRFFVCIAPEELPVHYARPWWELPSLGTPWTLCWWGSHQGTDSDRLVLGLERKRRKLSSGSTPVVLPQTVSTTGER
jgi:transcriptional regulator with XRE-family HTH domain